LEASRIKNCEQWRRAPVPCPLYPCGLEPRPIPVCQNNVCVDKNILNRIAMTFEDRFTHEPIKNYSFLIKRVIMCKPGGKCPEEILFRGATDANGKALIPPEIFENSFNFRTSGYIEIGPFTKDKKNPDIYTVSLEGSPYQFNYKKDNIVIALQPDKLLEIQYGGGFCPIGMCTTTYAISKTGFFTKDDNTGQNKVHLGQALDADKFNEVFREIETTDFAAIRSKPFTGVCPTAYDGQQVTYKFYTSRALETVSSCQTEIDYGLPLFVLLQEIVK